MMRITLTFLITALFFNCNHISSDNKDIINRSNTEKSSSFFTNKVMVVAHRGDWRNAPENSFQAVKNCIDMGVDMVEIDLKRTKDSVIILMHDKTLDRTTTGTGLVSDNEFDTIKDLFLKNGYGMPTQHKIPTLMQVLNLCKDKILVFLDKGYEYVPDVMLMVKKLNMEDQVFFEGKSNYDSIKTRYAEMLKDYNYMPRIKVSVDTLQSKSYIAPFLNSKCQIFICSVDSAEINNAKPFIQKIKDKNKKVMLTTLWQNTCAGYTDDGALNDPEANWGKVIELGANLICTDRPLDVINYLKMKRLHE